MFMDLMKSICEQIASAFKTRCTGDCNQGRKCACQNTNQTNG